jgi:PAS domain S-box-containing protein
MSLGYEDALKEIQEKYARQSRLFEQVAASTPDFIYVFDLEGRFLYANPSLLKVWGKTSDEAFGKSLLELGYEPWHAQMHLREIRQVIETRQSIRGEVPFTGGSGISGVYEYIFTPVIGTNGEVEAIAGTTRDVTQRKQAEEQMVLAKGEKERLLACERAARSDAERSNRMKDEFLATLSHELRTPLNAILGWVSILRNSGRTDADLEEAIEVIDRNARAQTQIIDDLLDMSRIISGKVRLDVHPVDLGDVVKAALETVQPAIQSRGIHLQLVLDPLAHSVSGDPNRLQQIFWNLLSNAVKFTPRGGTIQVRLARVDSHVEVRVADSGEGIAAEFLPYVFDRFRQADSTSTRRHGGLGLGLSLVKQLVELHGGSVRVTSDGPGKGAVFAVVLPLAPLRAAEVEDEPDSQSAPRSVLKSAVVNTTLEGVRVLVVDDEPDSRILVQRLLRERHAAVMTASSAAEALSDVQQQEFDLLISDVGMPDEDGYSLIRKVRAMDHSRTKPLPAIALTAYARTEDRVKSIEAGFQMHLAKPVEPVELLAMVTALAKPR